MINLIRYIFTLVATCLYLLAHSTTYFVRTDGNDSNDGLANDAAHAWETVNHAIDQLAAGDTLWIADGTYYVDPIVVDSLHATADDPTMIAAINEWGAKITLKGAPTWGNLVEIQTSSYLVVEGLELYQKNPTKGTGLQASKRSHHIVFRKNYVHDCGCNGISARGSDYVTVEDNIVQDNAKRSEYNCSGISYYLPVEHDQKPGFHFIIRRNIAFGNECRLPFTPGGHDVPTDGNGIILDLFRNTRNNPEGQTGGYYSETLIENNLSFMNGGRGIHMFNSDNVTVRNNTLWHNLYVLNDYGHEKGDLEGYTAQNVKIYNNIFVEDPELYTYALRLYNTSATSEVKNNLVVGDRDIGSVDPVMAANVFYARNRQEYPRFKNPQRPDQFTSRADFESYFGLEANSPAINRGNTENYAEIDINGLVRPVAAEPDMGCYEYPEVVERTLGASVKQTISLYPNPARGKVQVLGARTYTYKLYDLSGSEIRAGAGNEFKRLDLTGIDSGVYLLHLYVDGAQFVKRLVLN